MYFLKKLDNVCKSIQFQSCIKRKLYNSHPPETPKLLNQPYLRVSDAVMSAVRNMDPVIALESAIITHGMPYPYNIETALSLENFAREKGVLPATVGIIKGKIIVGLSEEEIEFLGSKSTRKDTPSNTFEPLVKVSRRDFPFVLSKKLSGGTTVSGTIIAASMTDIPIFVTGGIGGVHRGVENTFDISADLREMGRSRTCVISSGIKSFLDIGKTLEYLETEGVCVCVMDKRNQAGQEVNDHINGAKFPSFFTVESQFNAPYTIFNATQAAQLVHSSIQLGLQSGTFIAVPIPQENLNSKDIEFALEKAFKKAEEYKIKGKDMTPFLLNEINNTTKGESLKANQNLIRNNVEIGSEIAIELSKLRKATKNNGGESACRSTAVLKNKAEIISTKATSQASIKLKSGRGPESEITELGKRRPVVIGGSSMDITMKIQEEHIEHDGRTHQAEIRIIPGGVGRNMAEALSKLNHHPLLISTIGNDSFGNELLCGFKKSNMDSKGVLISEDALTAVYSGILNHNGEMLLGCGDMSLHCQITPNLVRKHADEIHMASIVILDGNLPLETISTVMELSCESKTPVWFEPTEVRKAEKILRVPAKFWSSLTYISPNFEELLTIARSLPSSEEKIYQNRSKVDLESNKKCEEVYFDCFKHFTGLQIILLTQGEDGFTIITRETDEIDLSFTIRKFPAPILNSSASIKSVSGAGDCLNAGFISGLLREQSLEVCAYHASQCAKSSLESFYNVPNDFHY